MTNSIAHYLRSLNVGRNTIVPIICERSYYYVIGIIGIMKAGGAFLPIDPEYPEERIKFMIEEVEAKIVLKYVTNNEYNEKLKNIENVLIYSMEQHNYKENIYKIDNINDVDDTCYCLFTSGTTGKPKGTLISHFNLINYIRSFNENTSNKNVNRVLIKECSVENVLAITNFSFDIHVNELLLSLILELGIVLVDENKCQNIKLLSSVIEKNNVNLINTTPSRIKIFMEYEEFTKILSKIKIIILAGEALPSELCRNIHKYSKCNIYNGYGPTECYYCTYKEINEEKESKITIGSPICNCKLYILDKYMNPVPVGVEGEIYIGGHGVGKGYLNRKELTNRRFIANPFNQEYDDHNKIMYRSGDLGKWTENGEIEYLGRMDFQVKIHGQRIELNEIENVMKEIPKIDQAIVIDKEKDNKEKYLIGYYICKCEFESKKIREYLRTKLPIYMVPSYFERIEKIPITNNGKLDRRALPEPSNENMIKDQYIKPETEIEKKICSIYSEVLNYPENDIGKMCDFYELGGESLSAIRVSSMIGKELNVQINIKDILQHPTVNELSKYIEEIHNYHNNSRHVEVITRSNYEEFQITSQQLGIYIDSIKNPHSIIYNVPRIYNLKNNVDIKKIKEGLNIIFHRHEIFRSTYFEKKVNGEIKIFGRINKEYSLNIEEYDYENAREFIRPFNLSNEPLIRVGFIKNEVLMIDIHHIIADGVSMSIISQELNNYYYSIKLNELEIQFSDYAHHLNEKMKEGYYKNQIDFYKNMFDNVDYELMNIPKKEKYIFDNDPNKAIIEKKDNTIGACSEIIDKESSVLIDEYVKKNGISKSSFFITVYGYVMSKYSGQDIIYSSVVGVNRSNHYIENMVGMFVSTQPILLKYNINKINKSFTTIIKENMKKIIEVYNNQDISYAELTRCIDLKKVNNAFIYQPKSIIDNFDSNKDSIYDNSKNFNNYSLYQNLNEYSDNIKSKFDISFNLIEKNNKYIALLNYDTTQYDKEMMKKILKSYKEVLKNISQFDKNIQEINYIPEDEKIHIIKEFNSSECKFDCNKLYHIEFSKIAKVNKNKCSIIFNNKEITYGKLDEMSNSLAHYLRKSGIGRNDIVPIISERSPYYIIASLAIMKSGGAFFPIDPDFPQDRIKYMIKEVNAKMILKYIINNNNNKKIKFNNIKVYSLENHNYKVNTNDIDNINKPIDLSYVMFTSGTTGQPKGTLITHNNIINYCLYSQKQIYGSEFKSILAYSKFTFDMSISEINYALLNIKIIVLCNDEEFNNPELLGNIIMKYNIDFIVSTPSRFKNYLNVNSFKKSIKNLKYLTFGGENLNIKFLKYLIKYTDAEINNGYGPTETTACCTISKIKRKDIFENKLITIGNPLCNYKLYILDEYLNP
ncbi:hypothetical protein PIROE2DRAFT_18827, partial [Piromyces sp. E2]